MDASRSQEFDWYYNRHEPVADRGKQVAAAPEQRRNEEDPRRVVRGPCRNGHAWGGRVAVGLVKVKHPGRGRTGLGAQDGAKKQRSAGRAMRFLALPRSLPLFSAASSPRGTRPASPNVCSGSVQLADRGLPHAWLGVQP